jgi:hypothetical protein
VVSNVVGDGVVTHGEEAVLLAVFPNILLCDYGVVCWGFGPLPMRVRTLGRRNKGMEVGHLGSGYADRTGWSRRLNTGATRTVTAHDAHRGGGSPVEM